MRSQTHQFVQVSLKGSWLRRAQVLGASVLLAAGLVACGGGEGTTEARQQPLSTTTTVEFAPGSNLSGAIYTTTAACGSVNVNQFTSKPDVYLNGGPQGGGSGLPDGNYWVRVTAPDGTVLGTSQTAVATVLNGGFVQCYQLVDIVYDGLVKGFGDTPNNGGVYKVWVSRTDAFDPNQSKTDNFKVNDGTTPPNTGALVVQKFYDANANGVQDGLEPLLTGWKVSVAYEGGLPTIEYTTYTDDLALPGGYSASEAKPVETNWFNTTPTTLTGTVVVGQTTTLSFGNVCLAGGNGRTLGFWSNKNGQDLIGADDLALLVSLNLRNANGSDFNPGNKGAVKSWLLSGTAVNMAYMLSVQMAAMQLNVLNGFVPGGAIIYAPGTPGANAFGFNSVNAVMAAANTSLGLYGLTLSGHPERGAQELLKNALDAANNSKNFVSPTPCAFSF